MRPTVGSVQYKRCTNGSKTMDQGVFIPAAVPYPSLLVAEPDPAMVIVIFVLMNTWRMYPIPAPSVTMRQKKGRKRR
jgi:hypothetical protein